MNAASPTRGATIGEEKKANLSIGSFRARSRDETSRSKPPTMRSPMLTVQAAPTSASLVHCACCDICPPVHQKYEAELNPLHMNWVLVGDTKGNPWARMRWVVEG